MILMWPRWWFAGYTNKRAQGEVKVDRGAVPVIELEGAKEVL
ncbi:MAG TPA: hypothetical protein VGO47_08510 [Chlamydiales bacterium]|nr:hypothetical protein [Chlamydiales bacterium]